MIGDKSIEWWAVAVLAAFGFFNTLAFALINPLGDAPDEKTHFAVVAFEYAFHDIPEVGVDDYGAMVVVAIDGVRTPHYTYAAQPGLAYIASAAAIHWFGDGLGEPARAARFPGALWCALLVPVVFAGTRRMFPDERGVGLLAATIAAFWPQLTFVFSYINNDGLTILVSSGLIASWWAGVREDWGYRYVILTGACAGLVLLNKPNGFPVAGVGAVVLLLTLSGPLRVRLYKVGTAGLACFSVSGWWYWIAFTRYGWDLLGEARADAIRRSLEVDWASGRYFGQTFLETAFGPFPRFGETWIHGTLRTAVGAFGELTIALPVWSYALVAVTTLVALVGVTYLGFARRLPSGRTGLVLALTVGLIPLELVLSLYRSWAFDFQAQGRYLFPAFLPYSALVALGLLGPLRRWVRSAVGFATTVAFAVVMASAFSVTFLGAYRLTPDDLVGQHPVVLSMWAACLLLGLALSLVAWMRGARAEPGGDQPSAC